METFIETKEERKLFYRKLFAMTIPIALQGLMVEAKGASDALMLGFVDQNSLSAVALAVQITFVVNLFIIVLTQGTTILAAQYWGKGDRKSVEMVLALAIKFVMMVTVVFSIGTTFFPEVLLRLFTSDAELITLGASYLRIAGVTYVFNGITQLYLCIMRNSEKTTKSAIIGASAMGLNIVLNTIFIFGAFGIPAMGIEGAAIATVLTTFIQFIWVLIESKKQDSIKIRPSYLKQIEGHLRKYFIKYTLPIVGNYMFYGLGITMYTVIMGHLGSDAVASYALAIIIMNLITSFGRGVGVAGPILVGNELGKDEIQKGITYAKRSTIISALFGVVAGIVLLLLRPVILGFSTLNPTATGYLSIMLLIMSNYVVPAAINMTVIGGIFCAGGKSQFGLICDAVVIWLIILPIGFLAAFYWQLPVFVVFFLLRLDEVVKVPIVFWYYRKYTWAKNLTKEA